MKDSYEEFTKAFNIEPNDFLDWGINNTIYPDYDTVTRFWNELKLRINNGEQVYVRGYGRDGKGNDIIIDFYNYYGFNVKADPNNNAIPSKNLQNLTCQVKAAKNKKKATLCNYQVSHIFGNTKNIFMFEAPWNICFVPKLFDPLTGHEALGTFPEDYKKKWLQVIKNKYQYFIDDYNEIVGNFDILNKVECFLANSTIAAKYSDKKKNRFKKDIIEEFAPL